MPSEDSTMRKKADLDKCEGQLVNNSFKIGAQIGAGSYGQVRIGVDMKTKKNVAMKFELHDADSQLRSEYEIYNMIQTKAESKKGFPVAHYFGKYQRYQVLVMELLGQNLESVFTSCNNRFTLKTMIFITLQMLKRFETLHSLHIVYRDVKPENFVLGSESNTIYVIDFGLSKYFVDSNGVHLPFSNTNEYIGTSRYMSTNAHNCREQSRRDDLQALCYMLAYFFKAGKLPWSGLRVGSFKEHNKVVLSMKRSISEEELMFGAPEEFLCLMKYCRFMDFDQAPNYMKLRNMFKRLYQRNNFIDDGTYDWNKITGKSGAALPKLAEPNSTVVSAAGSSTAPK